jgi:hypothetical protein
MTDNKLILSFINITERELFKELNNQIKHINLVSYINSDSIDFMTTKECIKFLKSIKKNILIVCALKRKKFNNEPRN